METHNKRDKGERWTVLYGSYSNVEQFAVTELISFVQRHLPYIVECIPADGANIKTRKHLLIIGTAANNKFISELESKNIIKIPRKSQGYTMAVMDCTWNPQCRMIILAGHDSAGVLHGTEDFNSHILNKVSSQKDFDSIQDFMISDYPRIKNRGLWTWGYVILDYRQFIDNMARLKMNTLTIWNDCPPLNMDKIISYAHSRGIKIIPGFPWGWGTDLHIESEADCQLIEKSVLKEYDTHYADLPIDGLYFQTLTEHTTTSINGKSVAEIASHMVNNISAKLFARNPNLKIQFGLHATSILDRYKDLSILDPRITIVWEDAGTIPYSYTPELMPSSDPDATYAEGNFPKELDTFEKTLEYSLKLATFRKDSEFAMVPKGWTCIDWDNEFEHHDNFILGENHPSTISTHLAKVQPRWDYVNKLWESGLHLAAQFYKEIINCTATDITMTGVMEDGAFEAKIQSSASIFSETLWNPEKSPTEIKKSAKRIETAGNLCIPSQTCKGAESV